MHLSINVKNFFKLLLPFVIWCFIYRGLLWGQQAVSEDTFAIFAVVKYFLSNIQAGVFPHWNPFIHWGMGHICQVGEFNPMWMFTLALSKCGVDFYHSFLWTVIFYMFLGAVGVYFLLNHLLKASFLAYLGFIFFLFSGYSMTVFTQMTIVLLFVPAVWFFYFLARFDFKRDVSSILWMAFCMMLIMTTYIPFYFLIVVLVLLVCGGLLYPNVLWRLIVSFKDIVFKSPWVMLTAVILVGLAMTASFLNWLMLRSDLLVLARPTDVTYEKVKDSGILIAEIMRGPSLFSWMIQGFGLPMLKYASSIFTLDSIAFDNQRIFYIPVLAHALIVLGIFAKLNKKILLWAMMCFILFLMAITRLSSVYGFLFEHVFFFKMFRNLFCLIPFISVFYILMALQTIKDFYCWILQRVSKMTMLFKMVVVVLAILPACSVLSAHAAKFYMMERSTIIETAIKIPLTTPVFSFTRPIIKTDGLNANDIYRLYNFQMIALRDTDHFISTHYGYPTPASFKLAGVADQNPVLLEYVRHKFYLYDFFYQEPHFENPEDFLNWIQAAPKGWPIDADDPRFKIERFDANTLQLNINFPSSKFFVYNDSFHPLWKAYVNDQPIHLYKSNFAFKGVILPKGSHHLRFEFEPYGGQFFYWSMLIIFYAFFILCIYSTLGRRRSFAV